MFILSWLRLSILNCDLCAFAHTAIKHVEAPCNGTEPPVKIDSGWCLSRISKSNAFFLSQWCFLSKMLDILLKFSLKTNLKF